MVTEGVTKDIGDDLVLCVKSQAITLTIIIISIYMENKCPYVNPLWVNFKNTLII